MTTLYDAVLFDAGETIVHPNPSFPILIARLLARRGHEIDHDELEIVRRVELALDGAFLSLSDRGEPFSLSADASRRFWTGVYGAALVELEIPDADGELASYLYGEFLNPESYALFSDAMPAMRELKALGYRLGVVSNWEAWLPGLLERLEVTPLLDVVVVSGVELVEKPDPKLFEIALDRMGVEPHRAVYVGDNPRVDIVPAVELGMRVLLVDRRGRHAGLPSIRSLEEIAGHIGT